MPQTCGVDSRAYNGGLGISDAESVIAMLLLWLPHTKKRHVRLHICPHGLGLLGIGMGGERRTQRVDQLPVGSIYGHVIHPLRRFKRRSWHSHVHRVHAVDRSPADIDPCAAVLSGDTVATENKGGV